MVTRIYALSDADMKVRYVGKTVLPIRKRLKQHLYHAFHGGKTYRDKWIRSLSYLPTVSLLEEIVGDGAACEKGWITKLKRDGAQLTNLTEGGEGVCGLVFSEESRKKMSAAHIGNSHALGNKLSLETRQKMSAARVGNKNRLGIPHSPEVREKIRRSMLGNRNTLGHRLTEAHKAKIGAASKGHTLSALVRSKLSQAMMGNFRGHRRD